MLSPAKWFDRITSAPLGSARSALNPPPAVSRLVVGATPQQLEAELMRNLKPGQVLYDIGLGRAESVLLAAQWVGENGRVFAFESSASAVAGLRQSILEHRVLNVESIPARLGMDPSARPVSQVGRKLDSASSDRLPGVESLDNLRAEGRIPPASVVRIGTQQPAHEVLSGGAGFFITARPLLLLLTEHFHSPDFQSLLANLGYLEPADLRRDLPFEITTMAASSRSGGHGHASQMDQPRP